MCTVTAVSYRTFSVSAEGKAVAVPDVAEFTFSVISEGNGNLADLQKDNTTRVYKISSFLNDKKIDDKDISTVGYQVDPRYAYFPCTPFAPCKPAQINGYTVTQTTKVKVRDFNAVGDLLSGVVTQGANSVSSLSFTQDDPEKAMNEARADAMKKARAQAEAIAKAGGFGLGHLVTVSENSPGQPGPYYASDYGMGASVSKEGLAVPPVATPSPTVQPGSQEVIANVSLVYEIK